MVHVYISVSTLTARNMRDLAIEMMMSFIYLIDLLLTLYFSGDDYW